MKIQKSLYKKVILNKQQNQKSGYKLKKLKPLRQKIETKQKYFSSIITGKPLSN